MTRKRSTPERGAPGRKAKPATEPRPQELEEDIETPIDASVDERFPYEREAEAGMTGGEVRHTDVTADDAAPETLIDDEPSRSPSAREHRLAADQSLAIARSRPAGMGNGPDEAEEAERRPVGAAEAARLQRRSQQHAQDARYLEREGAREHQARQQEGRVGRAQAAAGDGDGGALVIVADSVRAQLFVPADGRSLRQLANLLNPEGRSHERDLVSDAAGRRGHQPTRSGASAFGGESMKSHRAEEFAARVCERASAEVDRDTRLRIHVVAEPQFLGLLRQRMDNRLQQHVVFEVPKSLVGHPASEIRAQLPGRL